MAVTAPRSDVHSPTAAAQNAEAELWIVGASDLVQKVLGSSYLWGLLKTYESEEDLPH